MKNLRKALLTVVGTATLLIGTTTFANVTGTVTLPDGTKPETTFVDVSKITVIDNGGGMGTVGSALFTQDNPIDVDTINGYVFFPTWKAEAEQKFKDHWLLRVKAEKDGIEYASEITAVDRKSTH